MYAESVQKNQKQLASNALPATIASSTLQLVAEHSAAEEKNKWQQGMNASPKVAQLQSFQERANNRQQPIQKQAVSHGKDDGVVQRVVAPSFAAKGHRAPGTAIPLTASGGWSRPSWLRGERGAVQQVINDMIAAGRVVRSQENPAYIRDNLTGTWVPLTGVNIDHIVDWETFARSRGVTDYQGLEEAYHEMDNLQLTAARTNSSNSTTDVMEWMAGESHEGFMGMMGNPRGQQRLEGFFGEVVDTNPNMTMEDVPLARRGQFLNDLGMIQNPRDGMSMDGRVNGPELLMAYARARAMAGVDVSRFY